MQGTHCSGWARCGPRHPDPVPPRSARSRRERASARRAGVRERAPRHRSAPGRAEQDGGRAAAAAWAEAAAARRAEPRRLGRASPGPAAPDRAQVGLPAPRPRGRSLRVRPAWARGSRPPTPGPPRARLLSGAQGTSPARRPPLPARTAWRPRSLVPLAWQTSLPSPGAPVLGSLPATSSPGFRGTPRTPPPRVRTLQSQPPTPM